MNQSGIAELIKKGESVTVEFKENFDSKTIESSVAFANTRGGLIFIGVSDQGEIKGVQIGRETRKKCSLHSEASWRLVGN